MIKKFKVGKWYRYTGEKTHNWVPEMDAILDSKPRKVLNVDKDNCSYVELSKVGGGSWFYRHTLKDWEQVPKPKKQIDLNKPQIVKKDVLIEVRDHDHQPWVKRYLFVIGDRLFRTWDSGKKGKEQNYDFSRSTTWFQARHIQPEPTPEPKKVTIELTEEQAEKARKELGLGENK